MTDSTPTSIRSNILHLLSLPKPFLIDQFALEDLEPVSRALSELADALRHRAALSTCSTLAIKSNDVGICVSADLEACMNVLNRYTTLLWSECVTRSLSPLETFVSAQFKVIHQLTSTTQTFHGSSTLRLEITSRYNDDKEQELFSLHDMAWGPLWSLSYTQSHLSSSPSIIMPDISHSEMNIQALKTLHKVGLFSEDFKVFVVALSMHLLDLLQSSLGISLCSTLFGELISSLFDSSTLNLTHNDNDFGLQEPRERKRTPLESSMSDDIIAYAPIDKKACLV